MSGHALVLVEFPEDKGPPFPLLQDQFYGPVRKSSLWQCVAHVNMDCDSAGGEVRGWSPDDVEFMHIIGKMVNDHTLTGEEVEVC